MHRYLLPASIFTLALAVFADRLVPVARASGTTIVCEEGFRALVPAGAINRGKVVEWMSEQHAAGRSNFLPIGVNGSVGMICAW